MSKSNHPTGNFEGKRGLSVEVRNNNVESAIRLLGRKVKQEGLIREVRKRQYYEQPSTAKRRRRAEAQVRWRKTLARLDT